MRHDFLVWYRELFTQSLIKAVQDKCEQECVDGTRRTPPTMDEIITAAYSFEKMHFGDTYKGYRQGDRLPSVEDWLVDEICFNLHP